MIGAPVNRVDRGVQGTSKIEKMFCPNLNCDSPVSFRTQLQREGLSMCVAQIYAICYYNYECFPFVLLHGVQALSADSIRALHVQRAGNTSSFLRDAVV